MTSPKSFTARPAFGIQPFAGFARAAVAASKAVWTAMRNRRTVHALQDLDDYLLADIGLCRGDLRQALADPHVIDPSVELSLMARQRRLPGIGERIAGRRT